MVTLRSLTVVSLFTVAVPGSAFAASAEIRARITDLRVQPSEQAKARLKLGVGREVSVLAKSDDGNWVKVAGSLERGEDVIRFEGWIMAGALDGDVEVAASSSGGGEAGWGDGGSDAGSFDAPAASSSSGDWDFSEDTASSSSSSEANSWDSEPAAPAAAPAEDLSWESESSSSDSGSDSEDDWGDF